MLTLRFDRNRLICDSFRTEMPRDARAVNQFSLISLCINYHRRSYYDLRLTRTDVFDPCVRS